VPGERDELGDRHALVAHALDVLDEVQQRGDEPQVARHGRLTGQQGEDPLVDLEVATVEAVVVEDDDLGELDVLVLQRFEHAVELLDHHLDPAQRRLLEAFELLLEVLAPLAAHQPNFPVTYSSVRLSSGVENILSVAACSIISPASMNAVVSATRAACCMLCVTMTIV
jgi:hypothetical protein